MMRKPITTNISMKDLGARELGDWMLVTFPFTLDYFVDDNRFVMVYHRRKKWNDSLEGSLDWELFPAELEFPKILVSRLPQNSSNVNIECVGIYLHFVILILICFQLIMSAVNYLIYGCSSSRTTPAVTTIQELHTGGKTLLQLLLKIDDRW